MTKIYNLPGQVVIGDACDPPIDPSAQLAVNGTDRGALLPRMTAAQMNAIASPATGLIIYNTDAEAFYYFNGTAWILISTGGGGGPGTSGFSGQSGFSGYSGVDGLAAYGRTYFFQSGVADIGGYEKLLLNPLNISQDDESVSIVDTDGEVLIDQYVSTVADLNVLVLPPGEWQFGFWRYVDNIGQDSQIRFRVYIRHQDISETELFSIYSGDINNIDATYQELNWTTSEFFDLVPTDRLLVRVYALTTSNSTRTIHWVHDDGTASHLHTPIGQGITGQSGYSGFSGYSGQSGFSGYSGAQGTSGFSGYSGYSGTSGFSGYSGAGASGFSGYSGAGGSATSGFSGYSGFAPITVVHLAADDTTTSTTLSTIPGLDVTLDVGTYRFSYFVRYQSTSTSVGIGYAVNHTGTSSYIVGLKYYATTGTTDATNAASMAAAVASGNLMEAQGFRAENTLIGSVSVSVDSANNNMFMVIEGIIAVTASGTLELLHRRGTDTDGATITTMAGTNLVLTQVA